MSTDSFEKDPQFAYTLARGLQVLRAFEGAGASLGNREIGEIIGIPRSTVARLTRTLGLLGYLHYDVPTQRYRLTAAMLTLAYPVLAQLPVRQVARPHMQELANQVMGSVSLAMRDGLKMVLVESCVGPKAVTRPDIGAVRAIGSTALGMAYLAGLAPPFRGELLAHILEQPAVKKGDGRKATASVIQAELKRYDTQGFCLSISHPPATIAVGVPLRLQGGITMSLNCVVANHLTSPEQAQQNAGPRLVQLARELEHLMGRAT